MFQSVAGTQPANRGFGVTLDLLAEARAGALALGRGTVGSNVTYFETGQGSALSADAHRGIGGRPVDQQTLEARAYAVARHFDPLLVNTVVGFIGPEYLYDGKQIARAGLEDHFCGKLLGLPWNRALTDDHGVPYDIVCGTFFVAGLKEDDFASLTEQQIEKYKDKYSHEMILSVPKQSQAQKKPMKKEKHEYER